MAAAVGITLVCRPAETCERSGKTCPGTTSGRPVPDAPGTKITGVCGDPGLAHCNLG